MTHALHIYLQAQPGQEKQLEQTYQRAYIPAIKVQQGYISTTLLKLSSSVRRYEIDIVFTSEEKRLQWVASKEHQETWPKIEALCTDITWAGFEVIA